jgi:hypothetical protein
MEDGNKTWLRAWTLNSDDDELKADT